MYYIGLDVHKKTISYCVKDAAGKIHQEGKIGSTRRELDAWIKTLPQPRMMAIEVTIFTGWIYDHLLPHAEKVKVALGLDGKSLAQGAIRFGLMKSEISTVLVGFSNTAHIDEAVACSGAGGLSQDAMTKMRHLWDTDFVV